MKKAILIFLSLSTFIFSYDSTADDTTELSVTIYNNNFGVVKEKRNLDLKRNDTLINYKDVAQHIETDSLIIKGVNILESNYEYDLVNKQKLLSRYLGEKIYIMDETQKREYKLLSVNNGIVVQNTETQEIYLDPKGQMILPELKKELQIKPSFIWEIESGRSDNYIDVSYLTKKINWEANYVLNLKDKRLDLIGWVNIENNSGKDYKNSNLKLIAGDVKRVQENPKMKYLASRSSANAESQVKEQSFFDYHIYEIKRKTDLKNNQDKQIKFIKTTNSKFKKYYKFSNYDQKVRIMIQFENSEQNRLGSPLPKGKVKVYKEEKDMKEFVGEDRIDHTPKDKSIKLNIGTAFDIEGDLKQKDYDKLNRNLNEKEMEYTFKNHKDEDAQIQVEHNLNGDWEIINTSDEYQKESNQKVLFDIEVPANETKKINFRYRVGN
ncbi:MAG: DUF4139 domain-containing protein [Fusobacteriota bacterium]